MATSSSNTLAPPLVSSDRFLPEFTVKAFALGAMLSMLLAAANAYIGLLVGLTVSASIPAAAVSMGLLRLSKRSNILENNMVQTSASAGESLVAGIIFTIPALVMMGAWSGYDYGPMVAIGIIGGIMGVAFTIPLRRALIVEAKLKFPEGVATAEVLKTGGVETGGKTTPEEATAASSGFKKLLQAAGIGAAFKLLESGLGVFSGAVAATKSFLSGKYLFTGDIALSPALVGVGYIVGINIAMLVFLGGAIGTLITVPLNWSLNHEALMVAASIDPAKAWSDFTASDWGAVAGASWQQARRIGVGAMMIGGLWSLISLAKPLMNGIKASLSAYRASRSGAGQEILRTEFDTPINIVGMVVLVMVVPIFMVFSYALGDYPDKLIIASIMTVLMVVFGFIFSSVAGYMAGLVGSSNNPISGVTIATVVVSALLLLQLMGNEGIAATLGPIAVIYLAGLICSAAAIAGDNMQDLKCGHVLGSTPWRQQAFQIVGVVSAALVIPFILQVLDTGYGIGRPSPVNPDATYLAAPQAGLMQALASGIFGAGIDWLFIYIGFALAVVLIILDKIQETRGSDFRFPVLAVAVGVYLPLGLSVPIFIGGVINWYIKRKAVGESNSVKQTQENTGMLLASGLITGEALMGVLIAIVAAFVMPLPLTKSFAFAGALGVLALVGVILYQLKGTLSAGK
ncbi:MAG: OPT family oligopeptide transporter [Gammaproteobacteria bacterium]